MVSYLVPLSSYGATSEPLHDSLASTVSCSSLSPALALLPQPSASFISQASSCLVANVFLSSRVSFSYLNSHFCASFGSLVGVILAGDLPFSPNLKISSHCLFFGLPFLSPLLCRVLALEPADVWTSCGLFSCCLMCRQRAETLILPTSPDF